MAGWCPYCFNELTAAGSCAVCARERFEPAPDDAPAGTSLDGRYVIGRALGRGGFGVTYLGWQQLPGRHVAIKEYLPQTVARRRTDGNVVPQKAGTESEFKQGLAAFSAEARRLAEFQGQPHIVSVFDFVHAFGTAYMVMEYCPGQTALEYLRTYGGKLSFEDSFAIMSPVLDALQVLHRRDMFHRDVSPDNILLTERGVKLIDFGAARTALRDHSVSFSAILKMAYAPPEQYSRKGVQGPWTDVYACGATLYHLLCGEPPPGAMDRLDKDDLVAPRARGVAITQSVERAIMGALALDHRQRIQSAPDLKAALQQASGVGLPTKKASEKRIQDVAEEPEVKPAPDNRMWWAVLTALVVLMVLPLGAFGVWWMWRTPQIVLFQVEPEYAQPGQPVKITWQTSGTQRVEITPSDGVPLPSAGSLDVMPSTTTIYTLTAAGRRGEPVTDTRTVTVATPLAAPPPSPVTKNNPVPTPADPSGDQAAAAAMARLTVESAVLAGYAVSGRTAGTLKNSESAIWSVELEAGSEYAFVAAGDVDAADVDLTLRSRGDIQYLVVDQSDDSSARVLFAPETSGRFDVSVVMASCQREPCSVHVIRLVRSRAR